MPPKDKGKPKDTDSASPNHEKFYRYMGEIVALLFVLFFLAKFLSSAGAFMNDRGYITNSDYWNGILSSLFYFLASLILSLTITSNIISVILLMGIIYSVVRLNELGTEREVMLAVPALAGVNGGNGLSPQAKTWRRIQENLTSNNPSDWKLAVIEADVMLSDLLDSMNLPGETIGDKLKAVDKSDFRTLDNAWDAHKIRNSIAHEGADFALNEREAKRVIGLYERVFKEFNYV